MQRNNIDNLNLKDITFDVNKGFSPEEMKAVLYAKKACLAAKGKEFNCIVLSNEGELKNFLLDLTDAIKSIKESTRWQYILKLPGHWTSADILLSNGKLEVFLLDSIHSYGTFSKSIFLIKQFFPDAIITCSSGNHIQWDYQNCATFSLEFARQMAKISDLHDQIKMVAKPIKKELLDYNSCDNTLKILNIKNFPAALSPLLRNIQKITKNESIYKNNHFFANTKKSVSLKKHIDNHSKLLGNKIKVNQSILVKKQHWKAQASEYFNNLKCRL